MKMDINVKITCTFTSRLFYSLNISSAVMRNTSLYCCLCLAKKT